MEKKMSIFREKTGEMNEKRNAFVSFHHFYNR